MQGCPSNEIHHISHFKSTKGHIQTLNSCVLIGAAWFINNWMKYTKKPEKKRGDWNKYHVISSEAAAIAGSEPPSQCRRQLLLLFSIQCKAKIKSNQNPEPSRSMKTQSMHQKSASWSQKKTKSQMWNSNT